MSRSEAILEKNASKFLFGFILLHVLCWTLLPVFLQANAPIDVVEGLVWGHGWQWGYHRHPPLQAWLLETTGSVLGSSSLGYSALSAICSGLALWAIFSTGKLLARPLEALLAALLAEGILYFNFLLPEFNPNVLSLGLWALTGCAFAHAVILGRIRYWLALGVLLAACFYAKYEAAILALGFLLFMLADREARKFLSTFKPWLSLAVFIALMAPQFLWLVQNDFILLSFAVSRTRPATDLLQHVLLPAKFVVTQIADMLPMLLLSVPLLLPAKGLAPQAKKLPPNGKNLLFCLAFGPLTLAFLVSLCMGAGFKDMWGMPMLSFIPLALVLLARVRLSVLRLSAFFSFWNICFLLCMVAFVVSQLYSQELGYKPLRSSFPGKELARQIHTAWEKKTGAPLAVVIGDTWLAGNVALYAPSFLNRPQVSIDGNETISPWVTMTDIEEKGAVLVWGADSRDTGGLLHKFPGALRQKPIELRRRTAVEVLENSPPERIGWAIVKPVRKAKPALVRP